MTYNSNIGNSDRLYLSSEKTLESLHRLSQWSAIGDAQRWRAITE